MMRWLKPSKETVRTQEPAPIPPALLVGYSVYTSFKAPIPERWVRDHLDRLESSARELNITWKSDLAQTMQALATVPEDRPVVRLTVYPKVTSYRDLLESDQPLPGEFLMTFRPAPPRLDRPLRVKTTVYQRPMARIKHGSMLEATRLAHLARQEGFDDVLFLGPDGRFREASTSTVVFLLEGGLLTPDPIEDYCLPSITWHRIREFVESFGVPIVESTIYKSELSKVEGAFLCNAVQGVRIIERIDDHVIEPDIISRQVLDLLTDAFK